MMVVEAVLHWLERQLPHEPPEMEEALMRADREDALKLIARLDAAELKIRRKQERKNNPGGVGD